MMMTMMKMTLSQFGGLHSLKKTARDLNVERTESRPRGSSIHYVQQDTSSKVDS